MIQQVLQSTHLPYTSGEIAVGNNCCQNCLLMVLVNHVPTVCGSHEWYEVLYIIFSQMTTLQGPWVVSSQRTPPARWSHNDDLYGIHTAAWLCGEWGRGIWYIRHIMASVAVTLSTYSAITPRTKWTSSSVKSIHRSYKEYMVCVMVFDKHSKMIIIGPAWPCWHAVTLVF